MMQQSTSNKKIDQKTIIFMMLVSCLGIRWIPAAGAIGPSAIFFWVLGIVLFFIPLSIMIMEMSLNYYDEDGGIYLWVKNALGHKHGFLTAWFYWTNNLFFYPSILTFIAVNLAYFMGDINLSKNMHFTSIVVVASFWLAVFINILGMKKIAKVSNLSSIMNLILVLFITVAGFCFFLMHGNSATNFTLESFLPHAKIMDNISNLALLMFALSGMELIPTISKSVANPKRSLPRGVFISSIIIILFYLLGTVAINFLINPTDLSNSSGLGDTFIKIGTIFHLSYITKALLFMLIIVEFGAIILWLITPTIMFFDCVDDGILPQWLKTNNKNDVPANALIFQGIIVTIIVLLTNYLPSVNSIYNILILIAAVIYFLPFLYLAVTYYKLRNENALNETIVSTGVAKIMAVITFLSVVFGIITTMIPGSDIKTSHDILLYELELIGGPVIFIIIGLLLYRRRFKKRL